MRSILHHVRLPPALWGHVVPAGAVIWAWAGRIIRVWPVPLAWATALTMYAIGIWLIHPALFSEWAKREY